MAVGEKMSFNTEDTENSSQRPQRKDTGAMSTF